MQVVDTGELSPEEAADMVVAELETELGDDVIIREKSVLARSAERWAGPVFPHAGGGRMKPWPPSPPQTDLPTMPPQIRRANLDPVLFHGPAIIALGVFLVAPILVNILAAFTDMKQTVFLTGFPTTTQFTTLGKLDPDALLGVSPRSSFKKALALTGVCVFFTFAVFNVGLAVVLAHRSAAEGRDL